MIQLNEQTKVCFHEAEHTYTMGDIELSGVTTMLKTMLFQDKYKDVPEEVLQRAAEYGNAVHKQLEQAINEGVIVDEPELNNARRLLADAGIQPIRGEYLVSDEQTIASSIDIVASINDDEVVLIDTKTTSGGLDKDYLSWQLSVYAWLFELQNPHLKVSALYGLWLRHYDCALELIPRKDDCDVVQLLNDYVLGLPTTLQARAAAQLPDVVVDLSKAIRAKLEQQKAIDAEVSDMKGTLLMIMRDNGVKKFDIEGQLSVTYVEPTERVSLDTKKIQTNHPEIYEMYLKKSAVKESLKITLK